MENRLLTLLVALVPGLIHAGDANLISIPPDLVAFWTFGENTGQARVSQPGGFALVDGHATIQVTRVEEGPFSGFAASFDGAKSFLKLPSNQTGALDISGADAQVTVVSWIKRDDPNVGFLAGIWQEDNNSPRRQYGLFLDLPTYGGAQNVCGHVSLTGGPSPGLPFSRDYSSNQTPVLSGQWATVAFTYDGNYARSYLDGKFEARPTYTELGPPNGQSLTYAKNPYLFPDGLGSNGGDFTAGAVKLTGGMANFYKGMIGGLAVYRRALTSSELFFLHAASLDPGSPAAIYTFQNTKGVNVGTSTYSWRSFRNARTESSKYPTNGWMLGSLPGSTSENGYLAKTTFNETGIAWTDSIPAIPVHLIESISFTLNNTNSADTVRIAMKVSGNWFVSNTSYGVSGDGRTASDWSQSQIATFNHVRGAAAWLPLNFNQSDTLTIASNNPVPLPQGNLEAFGFYQPANAGVLLIDTPRIFVTLSELKNSTYAAWTRSSGMALADQSAGSDPDKDGVANLVEYALAMNPTVSDSPLLPQAAITVEEGNPFIELTSMQRKSADADIICEGSSNLSDWQPLAEGIILNSQNFAEGVRETVRWRTPFSSGLRFMRLRITTR